MRFTTNKKKKGTLGGLPISLLFMRLISVLIFFSISRWLIYLFNLEFFHHLSLGASLRLFITGMRFDLVTIAYANIPVILYYCLPFKSIYDRICQRIIDIYFVIANALIISFNMVDVIYFRFIGKRMTSEFFQFFGNSDENMGPIVAQIFTDYWFMLVLVVLFILLLVVLTKRTQLRRPEKELPPSWRLTQCISLLLMAMLTPIACRGGLQPKPVNMMTALKYADSQNVPIVLNTPFCIVRSVSSNGLQELHYYDDNELSFSPYHLNTQANRFITSDTLVYPYILATDSITDTIWKPFNLCIIVLESFGQEMIGYYNENQRYPVTPFMDSLLPNCLTFDGRANGRRSIESLPSILSGIPSLMDADLTSSPYFGNKIDGLGMHLQKHGYSTSVFHGGNNGTMNFDVFSQHAGFKDYYGRKEYNNDDDFDGKWGIFDGPYLQYCIQNIDTIQPPFATLLYTLSSHHPYLLPEGFELPKEAYLWSGFEKTVYYSDCALRDFFKSASQTDWYENTLFVITADHANTEHYQSDFSNMWGMYAIPIAFFMPKRIEAKHNVEIAQQIDLNVSILSALGFDDTICSFGRNVFDSLSEPYTISYLNQTYQYSNGDYLIQSDGNNTIGVFKVQNDRQLNDNLVDRIQCPDLAQKLRERLQIYNNGLIHNTLYIDSTLFNGQAEDTLYHQPDFGQDPQEELAPAN